MELEIIHDTKNQKFYTVVENKEAYLRYLIIDVYTLDFIKTYVPYELRGKGIAAKIVEAALNYAREKNLFVIPSCSYIGVYLDRNKKYQDLISDDSY